jgi:hypothetical protein
MKQANFTWTNPRGGRSIQGTVTLKSDGKTSISLHNAKFGTSMAERYQAKALANQIVAAQFKHEAITHFVESKTDKKVIAALTEKTQDLKTKFIQQTRKHARFVFDKAVEKSKWSEEKWYDAYGVKWEVKEQYGKKYISPAPGEYNGKEIYKMRNAKESINRLVNDGYEKHEAKEVMGAERHYTDSIEKLAARLHDKGITDASDFTIKTGWVGVNLEITIEHGEQITRAWTIVAEGIIQRPHYRYLVK